MSPNRAAFCKQCGAPLTPGEPCCDACGQRVAGLGVDSTTLMLGGIVLVLVGVVIALLLSGRSGGTRLSPEQATATSAVATAQAVAAAPVATDTPAPPAPTETPEPTEPPPASHTPVPPTITREPTETLVPTFTPAPLTPTAAPLPTKKPTAPVPPTRAPTVQAAGASQAAIQSEQMALAVHPGYRKFSDTLYDVSFNIPQEWEVLGAARIGAQIGPLNGQDRILLSLTLRDPTDLDALVNQRVAGVSSDQVRWRVTSAIGHYPARELVINTGQQTHYIAYIASARRRPTAYPGPRGVRRGYPARGGRVHRLLHHPGGRRAVGHGRG